ncbi:MAG: Crp/Fnr family transcriptional regulator [Sphingomicrobium sp.]
MDQATDIMRARIADAFGRNRLLATFSAEVRALIEPVATLVEYERGHVIVRAGQPVEQSLFPFDTLMVSMIVDLHAGRSVEVASIGKEGAVGGIVSCGHAPAYSHAEVQIAGPALVIPLDALETIKENSPFLRNLFCRYADFLLAQVMQSVACNAFHAIDARAARWLLTAQDRTGGDSLALTQESLAGLLGVQRTTVNAVARQLQEMGLISYRRGAIQILDRKGLERQACECYAAVEGHFGSIIGISGAGITPAALCG